MGYNNILLVDHTNDAQLFMTAIKAVDQKIKSIVENNALQALKNLNETKSLPDLIFLDYHMPYIEAGEFLELLRSIKGLKKVPVVFYCGHSFEAVKNAAKKHKAVWCIEKQNNLSMVTKSLKEILTAANLFPANPILKPAGRKNRPAALSGKSFITVWIK